MTGFGEWREHGLPSDVLLHTLTVDCVVPALLIDDEFRVVRANSVALDPRRNGYEWKIGGSYASSVPPQIARERLPLIEQSMHTGRRLVIDGMLAGMCKRSCYRPFEHKGNRLMFLVCWPQVLNPTTTNQRTENGTDYVEAQAHDLGPFTPLTERELEVLALVGRGLTNEEIAQTLHRSIKTVQGHRLSLGVKLGMTNRVQVAKLALQSGIVEHDLETIRMVWRHSRDAGVPAEPVSLRPESTKP